MSEACCGMAAEGHGCNCPTMKAETATVQEPDWIPDGDGRAIGQQDFAINLSPLHADTVGSPSPTFNEDITGQDGPSAEPTNASFAAFEGYRDRYDPVKYGHADVKRFRSKLNSMGLSNIVYDIFLYNDEPSKKTGRPANKAYYVVIVEKNGNYYPIAGHGGMNKSAGFNYYNIYGGKDGDMASVSDLMQAWSIAQQKINDKKKRKYRELPYRMNAESKGAETLAQIEGPTAEATSGGLHSHLHSQLVGKMAQVIPPLPCHQTKLLGQKMSRAEKVWAKTCSLMAQSVCFSMVLTPFSRATRFSTLLMPETMIVVAVQRFKEPKQSRNIPSIL